MQTTTVLRNQWTLLVGGFLFGALALFVSNASLTALQNTILFFGLVLVTSSILSCILAFTNRNETLSWNLLITAAIFDLLIGLLFLMVFSAKMPVNDELGVMSLAIPLWLILQSFVGIGFAFDLIEKKEKPGFIVMLILTLAGFTVSCLMLLSSFHKYSGLQMHVVYTLSVFGISKIVLYYFMKSKKTIISDHQNISDTL